MKCGKLTAKLRDAVPVIFIEGEQEVRRYKNIEIPDEIKQIEFTSFKFDVPEDGPITFKIYFEPDTLPEVWPENRARRHRIKRAERIATEAAAITEPEDAPATMEIGYEVSGDCRKKMVAAIGEYLDTKPEYMALPTYAYRIGEYVVSKTGILTGPQNDQLITMLAEHGFTA